MGGGFELAGGGFVISSPMWNNGAHPEAGAVTYCSSAAACMGDTVKLENSLVSDQDNNRMGYYENVKLSNGAYLVGSSSWMYEDQETAGALTWCCPVRWAAARRAARTRTTACPTAND